jgi:hypothetical protein
MNAENQMVDDGGLLQNRPIDIWDPRTTEMGQNLLEQLVYIVERVAADCIVQRADIRQQGIRINSRGIRRGKNGGIEKNVVADSPLAPVTVHCFSKVESNLLISI